MGKIEFANCQDIRNQKEIQELDCPRCHEPGGIEAFVKDGILAEDGVCDNCMCTFTSRSLYLFACHTSS